jgi:4-hydroxyphenylacetate 3-monooxygenase
VPCRFPSKKNTSPVDSEAPETKPWLDKYYTVNEGWVSEDRRKLLAFARDLHWDGPLTFVQKSAGLSDRVPAAAERKPFDKAPAQWLAASAMKAGTK